MRVNLILLAKKLIAVPFATAVLAMLLSTVGNDALAGFTTFEAVGDIPQITPKRDEFRVAVGGGASAGAHGDFGGVRREINWDGVPDALSAPNNLPADFFNVNSPRGVVFSTPGAGFRVSAKAGNAAGEPILFGFTGDLQTFSPERLFGTLGSSITDIAFFVPGTNLPATTTAFAAIFVDVEDDNGITFTTLEFFDQSNALIYSRTVPPAGNQGLSFLGGVANAGEKIARVRITTPNNFLRPTVGRDNEVTDFVIMDDFLYATPVPEPSTFAAVLLGVTGIVTVVRKRRK